MYCYILQKCSESIYLGENSISWSSKKQQAVIKSIAESEYRAMVHASAEITWITSWLPKEINFHPSRTPIWYGVTACAAAIVSSQSCVSFAKKTHKNISSLSRDKAENHYIEAQFIPYRDQMSNVLTNPLTCNKFNYTLEASSMCCYRPLRLKGRVQNNGMGQINQ